MPKSTKSTAIKKERESTKKLKQEFIKLFPKLVGNISLICQALKIDRGTYYKWLKKDEGFKQIIEDGGEGLIDHVESKLYARIDSGDTTAIIFFLKTKGRSRGYIEKHFLEHSGSETKPLRLMLVSDNPNDKNSKNRS